AGHRSADRAGGSRDSGKRVRRPRRRARERQSMLTGALLGAGNIARNGHLPAYLGCPELRERLRITAAADLSPQNLKALRQLLPRARLYTDAAALLDEERPDFVDICAPPYAHRPLIELAT